MRRHEFINEEIAQEIIQFIRDRLFSERSSFRPAFWRILPFAE